MGVVREYTNSLVDDFIDQGECEFVPQFATRLHVDLFLKLVDLPLTDRDQLLECTEMAAPPKVPEEREQTPTPLEGMWSNGFSSGRPNRVMISSA